MNMNYLCPQSATTICLVSLATLLSSSCLNPYKQLATDAGLKDKGYSVLESPHQVSEPKDTLGSLIHRNENGFLEFKKDRSLAVTREDPLPEEMPALPKPAGFEFKSDIKFDFFVATNSSNEAFETIKVSPSRKEYWNFKNPYLLKARYVFPSQIIENSASTETIFTSEVAFTGTHMTSGDWGIGLAPGSQNSNTTLTGINHSQNRSRSLGDSVIAVKYGKLLVSKSIIFNLKKEKYDDRDEKLSKYSSWVSLEEIDSSLSHIFIGYHKAIAAETTPNGRGAAEFRIVNLGKSEKLDSYAGVSNPSPLKRLKTSGAESNIFVKEDAEWVMAPRSIYSFVLNPDEETRLAVIPLLKDDKEKVYVLVEFTRFSTEDSGLIRGLIQVVEPR